MLYFLRKRIVLISIIPLFACSSDDIKVFYNQNGDEVGHANCSKQKLKIKKGMQPMTSYGYKADKWLTAGEHALEVEKSGIKSIQGTFASMFIANMLTEKCQ